MAEKPPVRDHADGVGATYLSRNNLGKRNDSRGRGIDGSQGCEEARSAESNTISAWYQKTASIMEELNGRSRKGLAGITQRKARDKGAQK